MQVAKIKSVKRIGRQKCLDFKVDHKDHNFYCEGLVTSNSHSCAYSVLAARTTWLKYKYPREFFTSILEMAEHEQEPMKVIAEVNRELPFFGIQLLPPSLENPTMDFSIDGDNIRYGLKSIKGISDLVRDKLIDFVKHKPENKYDVFIAAKECGININVLSSLIYAGALGKENKDRKALEAQSFNLLTDRERREITKLGEEYNYDLLECIADCLKKERKSVDDGKVIIKQKRFETFKKKFAPFKKIYQENKKREKLATWFFETTLLGYSPSLDLKDCFSSFGKLVQIRDLKTLEDSGARCVAQVDDFQIKLNKDNVRFISIEAADDTDKTNLIFGDWKNKKCSSFLKSNSLSKGDIIIFNGSKSESGDTFFVNNLAIVETNVYLKKADLKK